MSENQSGPTPGGIGDGTGGGEDARSLPATPPAHLDYECLRLIGQGGYGEVWLVRDSGGMYRACKVIYRESFEDEQPYEREYSGIKNFEPLSRIHASQVHILHVGRRDDAGYFYYIMELADDAESGQRIEPDRYKPRSLHHELIHRKRLPAPECIRLGLSLSGALEHLHDHGLIHRDIKPANIIFVNGIPKLADIGLVTDLSLGVSYVGTEGYMPPEGPNSAQGDIYSLGKVLYELSTGRDRLEFPELPADFAKTEDVEAFLELNAVVNRACQPDIRKRYGSARELRDDLLLLDRGGSIRQRRTARRRRDLAVGVSLCLALPLAGTMGIRHWWMGRPGSSHEVFQRLPLPEAGQLARTEVEVRRAQDARLIGGNEGAASVASDLLKAGPAISDPVLQCATLRVAGQLAIEGGDFRLASETCDLLAERFVVDDDQAKLELLGKARVYVHSPESGANLAEACLAAGFEAMALDDYPRATGLEEIAKASADGSASPPVVRQAEFLAAELARCGSAYAHAKEYQERLGKNPGDPGANLGWGEYLCFVKNDWEGGLPKMAMGLGKDAGLKEVIENELKNPFDSGEQVATGDLWWDLASSASASASEQAGFQRRARYWYLRGIGSATAPEKAPLRERLSARIRTVPLESGEVTIVARVAGVERIELRADAIIWKSNRGSAGDRINHVFTGDIPPRGSKTIRNNGATRLFPEGVDFTTAQLVDQKERRRGKAALEVGDDQAVVVLSSPGAGRSDFEVTVTFGDQPLALR